jgi:Fe-S-cluster-containing hydrogenase component 2
MRRPGRLGWLTHDLTHRGVTAWVLSAILLGFYFGLYLTAETKQLLTWLGVSAPASPPRQLHDLGATAVLHLRFPGFGAWVLSALVGGVASLVYGYFVRRDEGGTLTDEGRRGVLRLGGSVAGLTAGTMYASHVFANLLEPVELHGRHLLPSPGASWPTWLLGLLLAGFGGGTLASLKPAWDARAHRDVMVRKLALPLALVFATVVVLLYGTHVFDPAHPVPEGTRSLTAFAQRLYRAMDSKWGLYGLIYTMSVTTGGVYMLGRYGHNRYQVVRTLVVMTVQTTFGFSIPVLLGMFRQPEYYLSYFWPLKIDAFYPDNIFRDPTPFILWSFVGSLVFVPVMGIFFGKRWYCSWVCGCGGLANTAGEPFRALSAKGESAWRFEKVAIHSVLALAIVTTVLVVMASFMGSAGQATGVWWPGHGAVSDYRFDPTRAHAVVNWAGQLRYYYGVVVVSVLSGAIGVGLYPLGGTRQWCRNFCPMAAFLGLVQKFGRYRIRVKDDMCISCGMCTKACEMGIDVRAYAQANQSFTRASCVGCGMCAEACPRGVLQLENRFEQHPQERHRHDLVQLRLHKNA